MLGAKQSQEAIHFRIWINCDEIIRGRLNYYDAVLLSIINFLSNNAPDSKKSVNDNKKFQNVVNLAAAVFVENNTDLKLAL